MAGNWIKFDTSTSDKPEVWAIATKLNIDPDAVVGKLLRIWTWFDDHSEKGNAPIVTRALLDRRVGVTGFVTAMIEAGWMQEEGDVLVLPNFDRHNGQTAKNRALTAKRVSEHKKSNAAGNAKGNALIVTSALPKEEKNREEKSINEVSKDTSCSEQSSKPVGDSGFVFATQNGAWHLQEKKLAEYVATYRFDVKPELLKAAQWLRDNTSRRPRTGTGVQKFLTRWLNRRDDSMPANAKIGGKIGSASISREELERTKRIREARRNGQVSDAS